MVKLAFTLRRREGSRADVLGIRRSVPLHTLLGGVQEVVRASRGAPEADDSVAELWYDTLDAIGAGATEEGRAAALALLEDERTFIGHARSPLWFAEEHELVGD